ncbi:hypothetical protein [Agrobacterium sp. MCAB5]|uniref:hypothetical protein n=1 Tax=Agrobacterium sp. MCAB5 TaxID=3233042 RepID=UPI003F8F4B6E
MQSEELKRKSIAFDDMSPDESIGAFGGSGQWVELCTVRDMRKLETALPVANPIRWMWEERRFAESDIWDDMYDDEPPAPHKQVRNIRPLYAAPPAPPAPSVAVKALEWAEGPDGSYMEVSESILGTYRVWEINGMACVSLEGGPGRISGATIPEAKAAAQADYDARIRSALAAQVQDVTGFQQRVEAAHRALFHDDPTDVEERRARFWEEAGETVQAFGMTEEDAIELVRYTWSRAKGEPAKEIGAAMLTLASLCVVAGYDLSECAEADLEKLQRPETIARIRAKRSTRHGRGPLPGFDPEAPAKQEG